MKNTLVRIVSVIALMGAAIGASRAWAQGAGYWHTSGNRIVDSNGQTVRIAGVNWYGFETADYLAHGLWAQDYKTVLNTIRSLGYNVIRLPFSNQMVESNPTPGNYTTYANGAPANSALAGQTALADMDTIIAYAGSIGLRVILDNHRSEAGNSNEANGLWYTSAYPQSAWINDWKTLAARYSAGKFTFNGNPTVIGMDLRNEPHLIGNGGFTGACWTGDTGINGSYNGCPAGLTAQNWPVAAEAAGNAILAINPGLLIVVEGNDCYDGTCGWQGGNLMGVASHPIVLNVPGQLVYSAHDYGPNLYGQSWFNGSTTPASLDAVWNKFWGYISANDTAPVWVGEFGTDNNASDIQNSAGGSQGQWFRSLISYLQANPELSWTYWALNGEDSYGLLDSNYTSTPPSAAKQSLLASLQFPLSGGGKTPACTAAPAAPAGLKVTAASSTSMNLSWTAVTPPANCSITSYAIFRGTEVRFVPSSSSQVGTTSGTTFVSTGLSASTTYYYRVEALDTDGSSPASNVASASTPAAPKCSAAPAAPSGLAAVAASSSAIDLSWNAVAPPANCSIGSYAVYRGASSGFTPSAGNQVGTASGTTFSNTGLTASTTYYYKVEAVDAAGHSQASSQASATTLPVSSGAFACHVGYSISAQWPGGFQGLITISNTGTSAINGWKLTWAFANGQQVTQLWNGTAAQSGANVTVTNLSYNGTIPAGGSYSGVGFNGSWNNAANAAPTAFSINGTACH